MTYCLGIMTRFGLVMASDSRTNAGYDQINVCRKMHTLVQPGERVFVLLTSGSLSCSQSVLTLLRRDFDKGEGLAKAANMYDAARIIGEQVRKVAEMDRESLERDDFKFNVHIMLGGQIKGEEPCLFLIYPQGNPIQATEDSPYLQIGEAKYGRPILDRGIVFQRTSLEEAAKYALLSLDSTMKSNVTVGPPIDLLGYETGQLAITHYRRFGIDDPDLAKIRLRWQQALRQAVSRLPNIRFTEGKSVGKPETSSIQLVETGASESATEPQPQLDTKPAGRRSPAQS